LEGFIRSRADYSIVSRDVEPFLTEVAASAGTRMELIDRSDSFVLYRFPR
jgi:hypothetical protein